MTIARIVAIVVFGLILGTILACGIRGCIPDYSDGNRLGFVTKLSQKGLVWKSWEGEMNLGGFTVDEGGTASARSWEFSVTDSAVAARIREAMLGNKRVRLSYRQFFLAPWKQDTQYVVHEVKSEN